MNTKPMGVIPRIHEVYAYLYGNAAPMSMLDDLGDVLQAIGELIAALDEQRAADARFYEAGSMTPADFKRLARADECVKTAIARVKGEA